MNPFQIGVIQAKGLHAVMTRERALEGERKVKGKQEEPYPFFYNPMWGLFGDATDGPPGTYHYSKSRYVEFFWHMFDQVLVRPDLLHLFRNEDLKILTGYGNESFLSMKGLPRQSFASDHLPVLFKLNL